MSVKHTTDFAPLIDGVASGRLERIAGETVHLLRRMVPPFFLIGHTGVPAAWGDSEGHPVSALAAGGQIADWTRFIPASSEAESEEQRWLAAALPLTAALAVASQEIQASQRIQHTLPAPLFPANITHPGGMSGALCEAVREGQVTRTEQLLLGYYGTGTDYRAYLTNVYHSIIEHYTGDAHSLIFTHRSSQVLDMAGWGNKLPAFIHWLAPLLATKQSDAPFMAEVTAFFGDPAHELKPLRTRLAPANPAAAGAQLRQTILQGSLGETCTAVYTALMNGAQSHAVGSVIVLAAARRFLATPESDAEARMRTAHVLLVASAARTAVNQLQDVELLPLLFIAAAAVNGLREEEQIEAPQAAAISGRITTAGASLAGGILAPVMLRSLERQLESGDEPAAQATIRRYLQLGHPAHGLVALLALVACRGDATSDAGHTLLLAQAAAEEYLALPPALLGSEGEALLLVGVQAASRRPVGSSILEAVQRALA